MRALILLPMLALAACGGEGGSEAAVTGTPCATLDAAGFQARGVTLKNTSTVDEVTVRRQFGRSECQAGRSTTCTFSSPGVLHVTAAGRDSYFDIPVGQPATLTVSGGEVRCVLTREQKQ